MRTRLVLQIKSSVTAMNISNLTALPEVPKPHNMIFESKCSSNREEEHPEVEQHDHTHWANQTPHYRLIDRQPATAYKTHGLSTSIQTRSVTSYTYSLKVEAAGSSETLVTCYMVIA
jgi:hypothetical protein